MKDMNGVKQTLTTEGIRSLFKNNFDLANYAIRLARFYIKSGHEIHLGKLLTEVKRNPNEQYLEDLKELETREES